MTYAQTPGIETVVRESAVVMVDYENLYAYFADQSSLRQTADEVIGDLTEACRKYLSDQWNVKSSSLTAYADFSLLPSKGREIQRRLYLNGIEPHFVPGDIQKNAVELQLCIDAIDAITSRSDIDLLAIVTAERMYLPLVTHCQHAGIDAVIINFLQPQMAQTRTISESYINGKEILSNFSKSGYEGLHVHGMETPAAKAPAPVTRSEPVEYKQVTNPAVLDALVLIEEHFGQYNEIFLTPLLRKLSEFLGDQHDPKQLVNELEEAGAIWLEKRSGYPYDFTVMILDSDHPDVAGIQIREEGEQQEDYFDEQPSAAGDSHPIYDNPGSIRRTVFRRLGDQG